MRAVFRGLDACLSNGRGPLLALVALVSLLAVPVARADKAVEGEFGTPAGSGKGQLDGPKGVAVNLSGAGGVSAGDVYIVDGGNPNVANPGNNRIVEFSADGSFVRAWGIDVVASGPDDKGSNTFEVCLPVDVCKAGIQSEVAGGMNKPVGIAIDQENGNVYVIDANGNGTVSNSRVDVYSAEGTFEGAFGWKVNASSPEEKLQFCTMVTGCQKGSAGSGGGQLGLSEASLPALAPLGTSETGDLLVPDGGNFRVQQFKPTLSLAKEVTGIAFVKTFGWDVVASGASDQSNEVQRVAVSASAGKFTLSFGADTTGELDYDIPASGGVGPEESLQNALNALPAISVGGGSVTVSGGPGDETGSAPYVISFDGSPLAHTDVAQLVGHKATLAGGSPAAKVEVETYANGAAGLESCVPAAGDVCKGGVAGGHMGQFSVGDPTSVAVDSSGALYAVNRSGSCTADPAPAPCRVYKFRFPGAGEVTAEEFAPAFLTQTSGSGNAVNPTDVSVDPANDNVLVAKKEGGEAFKFLEFDSAGTLLGRAPPGEAAWPGAVNSTRHGLAIGADGRFYFSNPRGEIDIFGPPPAGTGTIGPVDAIEASTATFQGTVTPAVGLKGEHFPTGYRFEYSRNGISWKRFPASDVSVGDGSGAGDPKHCPVGNPPLCEVSQEVTGLEPNADYLARLVVTNGSEATSGTVAFTTKAAPPSISDTLATGVGRTSAKLTALVNPNNQPTTYHIEWGETTAYGNEAPGFDAFAGAGGQAGKVSASITGLKEGLGYHFRVVASNQEGETIGPDQAFTTLNSFSLPDQRAPEQASPNDKRPVGLVGHLTGDQMTFQAALDGDSTLYPLLNGLPGATAGGNLIYEATRGSGSGGWLSSQITPPALVGPVEGEVNPSGWVRYASADLSCVLVDSFGPLSEDTPAADTEAGVKNLYRQNPDGTFTLLSAPVPLNLPVVASKYHVDWASADCSHVLFDTNYRLLPAAPAGKTIRGLYEWAEGTLRLADVLPDESTAGEALAGAGTVKTNWNSMSVDGSKVFFTANSNEGGDSGKAAVFVRKGGMETVDASQSQTATANDGASNYQMAAADGSRVFFTARYGLANNGTSTGASSCNEDSGAGCDLYAYDVDDEELTDLSADANLADLKGAGVVGLLDAADDGSHVYFAARGQLVANRGKTEAQNLLGSGTYNVYLSHNGSLSYVGAIGAAEVTSAASGSDLARSFSSWVADATPDGKHLLFVSKENVTGYESGGVAEAYLYSATSVKTVCVSCREDGQKSIGNAATEPITAKGQTETGNGAGAVQKRPRAISDDGSRVFFKMPDVLAPGARKGARNIYEWENGQVYLLLVGEGGAKDFAEYADASASGDDVFVVSKQQLVAQDFDNTTDLYDLRAPHVSGEVVGPGTPEVELPPCDPLAHLCKPPVTPQPGPESPAASAAFSGPGNPPTPGTPHKHKGKKHKGKGHKGKGHHRKHTRQRGPGGERGVSR